MPVTTMRPSAIGMSGSSPQNTAHHTIPAANTTTPNAVTAATPKRAISRPETRSDVTGTMNGPGAMAMPVFSADQPQPCCIHSAVESSIAPNANEYGAMTSAAPLNGRMRKSFGSTNGFFERKQSATNKASRTPASARLNATPRDANPQSVVLTMPKESAPMPIVTSIAPHASGFFTSWP